MWNVILDLHFIIYVEIARGETIPLKVFNVEKFWPVRKSMNAIICYLNTICKKWIYILQIFCWALNVHKREKYHLYGTIFEICFAHSECQFIFISKLISQYWHTHTNSLFLICYGNFSYFPPLSIRFISKSLL